MDVAKLKMDFFKINNFKILRFFCKVLWIITLIIIPIGLYALSSAFYLTSDELWPQNAKIKQIGNIILTKDFFWTFPEFNSPSKEKRWWDKHAKVFKLLASKEKINVIVQTNHHLRQLEAKIVPFSFKMALQKTGIIYVVVLIYLISIYFMLQRFSNLEGYLVVIFLLCCAIYIASVAPSAFRPLTLEPKIFKFFIGISYIASGGFISLVHFSLIFPKRKAILNLIPGISWLFYLYFLVTTSLYFLHITAFDTSLPFFVGWCSLLIWAFLSSFYSEEDILVRRQLLLILSVPIFMALVFIFLHVLPMYFGMSILKFPSFALISLILPFAFPLAMDNIYLYDSRLKLMAKVQKDREQLRQELHDFILNKFSIISASIPIICGHLRKKDLTVAENKIKFIGELARYSSHELRSLMGLLNQDSRNWEDYSHKIRYYSRRLLNSFDIDFNFSCAVELFSDPPPPLLIQVALLRIISEALINIVKHSGASYVDILIFSSKNELTLEINDNGQGFDPKQSKIGHYGLQNIEKQASAINGKVAIKSIKDKGTHIKVTIPLISPN